MMIKHCLFFSIIFLSVISEGYSQNCPTPGQSPSTAFPVCGTTAFDQNTVPLCTGTDLPGPCGAGFSDRNPFWYSFRCFTSGTLGFLIKPNNLSDDYDWQLFDVTGHNPNDVYTDATLFLACNWSGLTGITGASPAGTSLINCDGNSFPIFSRMPSLIAGHDYLLMVSHFTPSQSGYQLTFTGGSAVITDPLLPQILSVTPSCDGSQAVVRFNKKIKCSSLASNGSDFFNVPALLIASAVGYGCGTGFDMDSVLLTFVPPFPTNGTFVLGIINGTDGNTLLDNCDSPIPVGTNTQFTITPQPPLPMGIITPPPCAPTSLTLTFADPIKCNSLAANGSDFTITGPSAVTVNSATAVNCNANGETNTITIQLSAAILAGGTYQVNAATGSDGNTLIGNCNRQITAGDNTPFTIASQSSVAIGTVTPPPCTPSSITLTFAEPIKCNSVAANGSDFVITGPAAVTVSSATAVNCNAAGETISITIQFSAPILVTGNYQVQMATGTDGNTLIGNCNRQVNAGENTQFTLAAQTPIAMGAVTPPSCTPSSITLTFAEPIKCNSVASNGSDFVITGPSAVTVISAASINCNGNGETTGITIQLSAPILITGNYQVQMAAGSDGNTLLGNCNRQVTTGTNTPFTLASQTAITMGSVTPPPCTPSSITLTFAEPVLCNSIAPNGSDFVITGPSAVTVSSAIAVNCNVNGETNTITIQFSAPIPVAGTYQVQVAAGSDGNTLTGQCNRQVTAGSNTQFILAPQPAIAMGTITPPPCVPQLITLTFADPIKCNSIAANGSDFLITGASPVTITSAAAVNCDGNGETNAITVQFATPLLVTGTYQVQVVTGSDGNTLMGQCGRRVTAGDNTTFTLATQPALPMGTVTQPSCSPSSITLSFTITNAINCMSIAANGSDFVITGPSPVTITSAAGTCNINPSVVDIIIQFAAPITTSGTYQLQMVAGTDGNTLTGSCNRAIPVGDFTTFTIPPASPVAMDSLVPVACSPSSLKLIFAAPIKCSSVAANGSDFIVTGPSNITVASAAGTCDANGLTTSIDIRLSSPVVVGGTYQLQLVTGSDGNTLLSGCNRQTPASSLFFTTSDTVSAEFQYQVQYDCQTDVIAFSHDGQHNVNQWTWTVNGTAASTSQTFTQSFSAASQNQIQLVVSNGVCNDTYSTPIVLNNKVTVAFEVPESVCPEDTAVFINKSTGPIDTWQWNFGNGNTSALQNPPAQIYPLTGIETLYTVSLTAGNNNCRATATETLKVLSACIIAVPTAFTPNNDGLNDYLYPLNAIKAERLDFKVFNRWGQLVFHSRDWTQKWDGRINGVMQATDVYIWTLNFTHKDTKQKYSLKGTSALIR